MGRKDETGGEGSRATTTRMKGRKVDTRSLNANLNRMSKGEGIGKAKTKRTREEGRGTEDL